MNYYRFEHRVMGSGQGVRVVDASSAIGIGIGQDDDVFVRNTCQPVVDRLHASGCKVAVGIEGVEVGADCRRFPFLLTRDAGLPSISILADEGC